MAQLDPMQKYSPKTPKPQPSSPTFEQLLHDLGNSSPVNTKNLDIQEYFNQQNKKSVLSRMRDKVKKFRHTLSAKKMDEYPPCGNTTPSWGVSLDDEEDDEDEDEEEEDEDPEYLGAPMYESELAPESYKESARQHPRAVPVLSERHIVPSMIRHKAEDEKNTPSKTITETVSEKLAPAYAVVSDVTHTIASSIVNLKISSPKEQENHRERAVAQVLSDQSIKSPGESDKGVSVKEYVMHKLEPGDDEKALSKVLCDALSPTKKSQGGDAGMVGKMREVVTSILQDEELVKSKAKMNKLSTDIPLRANPKVSLQHSISAPTTNLSPRVGISSSANSSSPIPLSTNPREVAIVVEEENHGRVLQAN